MNGFQQDALAAITVKLLSSQAECRGLEEENKRLNEMLLRTSRLGGKLARPTRGQRAVEEAFLGLEDEILDGREEVSALASEQHGRAMAEHERAESLVRDNRELRAQVANLKLQLTAAKESSAQLEAALNEERGQQRILRAELDAERRGRAVGADAVLALTSTAAASEPEGGLEVQLAELREQNQELQEQYKRLYEYISEGGGGGADER